MYSAASAWERVLVWRSTPWRATTSHGWHRLRRYAEADAQSGGERLRKRTEVDHVVRGERLDRRHAFAGVAEVAVRVVFEQQRAACLEYRRYLLPAFQGHRASGWVLECGDEVDEFHGRSRERAFERLRHQAIFIGFESEVLRFVSVECLQCTEVCRRFDRHDVPGRNEEFPDRIQHALRAAKDEDAFGVGGNSALGEVRHERIA